MFEIRIRTRLSGSSTTPLNQGPLGQPHEELEQAKRPVRARECTPR
jgi:hypothetical protein